jgi:mycothiol synthase
MPPFDPPPGYITRRPTQADVPAVADLVAALDLATDGEAEQTASDLAAEWHGLDLERDVWLVESPAGGLAAYIRLASMGRAFWADGYVHPNHHGRGLGRYLVRLTEGEARSRPDGQPTLQNAVSARDPAGIRLLESEGYSLLLTFWRMGIVMQVPPAPPSPPPGIVIRAVTGDEWEEYHAARERAFGEDPTHIPEDYDRWLRRRQARADLDPSLWFAAFQDARMVGIADCALRHPGGFVQSLGVLPEARRRGLGEALLHHAFGEFWRRGVPEVRLGVHDSNPTGATRLYERVGMSILASYRVYETQLR